MVRSMKKSLLLIALLATKVSLYSDWMPPKEALNKLQQGNERYLAEKLKFSNRSTERRMSGVEGQTPFAVVVGCSDSRTAPEVIFDQGIGDLFVVRVAGNVVGPTGLDSIEFAVTALESGLVLVMGHQNCGAINAVMQGQTQDIEAIAKLASPKIRDAANLTEAIKANASYVADNLRNNPIFAKKIEDKRLEIVAAYYDFTTGKVEILDGR